MALPVDKSRWATLGATITDPSSGQRDTGWTFQQNPPSGVFNSWMNNIYLHVQYLRNITAEVLTWTAQQTFRTAIFNNTGSLSNVPATIQSADNSTGTPVTALDITAGAYSGGSNVAGGKGAVIRGGDSGTSDAGLALELLGGEAQSATGLGGGALKATAGMNPTSGKGGTAAEIIGGDGEVWSGNGQTVTAGDLVAGGAGTVLRSALTVFGGSCYTDGTKVTLGSTPSVEAAFAVLPGKMVDGFDVSTTGIFVQENTAATVAPFTRSQWGVRLGPGYMFKQDPISTVTYPVGSSLTLPIGVQSPWGTLGACGKINVNGGSGGSFTPSVVAGSDRLNITSVARTSATTLTVMLTTAFLDAEAMFPIVQSNRTNKMPVVTSRTSNTIVISFSDGSAAIDLDASSDTNIPIFLTVFGR